MPEIDLTDIPPFLLYKNRGTSPMDTIEAKPEHSPLGGSSAERWMNCPGSIALIDRLKLEVPDDQTDEPEYRAWGTAGHWFSAEALKNGCDAWEMLGLVSPNGITLDQEMANAIQVYLDHARKLMALPDAQTVIEHPVSSPKHKFYYGQMDLRVIVGDTLHMRDAKFGEGIQVDAEWNEQLMYYTYPELEAHPEIEKVTLGIVQPRGFHPDGPERVWETDRQTVIDWAEKELLPKMAAVEFDKTLDAGPWCRFCPAKLLCPMLTSLFRAAATHNPNEIHNINDESLGRSYQYLQAVKFYLKALEEETLKRSLAGRKVPGTKVVSKRATRVFKQGKTVKNDDGTESFVSVETIFTDKYGDDAWTEPKLKSPAEMEKLGAAAKELVKEHAYTPHTGYTIALESDRRLAVPMKPASEVFADAAAKITEAAE